MLYLVIRNIAQRWQHAPRDGKQTMTHFAILYPDRFTLEGSQPATHNSVQVHPWCCEPEGTACACAGASPPHRVQPETVEVYMATQKKVTGPASYFPSIEKQYGQPIEHWMRVLKKAGPLKHMELVSFLKSEHQLGHGHANALVAWYLAKK